MNIMTFQTFLAKWESQFKKVPFIIDYLLSYPILATRLKEVKPINYDELCAIQQEWLRLLSIYKTPQEQEYFKSYWVPLQALEYDSFIDLSCETLPIFSLNYFSGEHGFYYKWVVLDNLSDILSNIDNPLFDFEHYDSQYLDKTLAEYHAKYEERYQMGLEGKINPDELGREDVLDDSCQLSIELKEKTLIIYGVYAAIAGLLSFESEVNVTQVEFKKPRYIPNNKYSKAFNKYNKNEIETFNEKLKIKTVKALLFYLQSKGFSNMVNLEFSFKNNLEGSFRFNSSCMYLSHPSAVFLQNIQAKFLKLKDSPDKYY